VIDLASKENFEDGEMIFEEGSTENWIYVLLSGKVEISKNVGGKKVVIQTLQPDDVFGELVFLGDVKRTATAQAVGETTVGIIEHEFLTEELNRLSPKFRYILLGIVRKLKRTTGLACKLLAEK
jgi:CRP-like cAMP-binding protein